ncbi:MAG: hypothetical protein EHM45_04750 [Desulfobacteraceae bacterium]|nr:MAG: hypothetical protein EHM45_04750 [Desulfobacteraceae bacterium]
MNIILVVGFVIVLGFLGGLVANRFGFPKITGYLLVGVGFNPSFLSFIPQNIAESLNAITPVVLGIISYHIGGGLHLESIKKMRNSILWITIGQSLMPCLLTMGLVCFLFPLIINNPDSHFWNTYFPMAIILGAIAISSAPAAIVAIIHECKAKGPVITISLTVLALTDAAAVLAFALALGVAKPMVFESHALSFNLMILNPLLHIGLSALIGLLSGFVLVFMAHMAKSHSMLLVIILGIIFSVVGLCQLVEASPILANMIVGFIAINKSKKNEMLSLLEEIEDVIFAVFFVVNGMCFNILSLKDAGVLTAIVIVGRWGGKYFGARIGAAVAESPESIRKYPGLILLPKAGLTLGLAFIVKETFPGFGNLVFNALITSTLINMIITPPLAKYGIAKSNERTRA